MYALPSFQRLDMPVPTSPRPPVPSRPALIRMLDEAFHGPAWHGPSVRMALKGISAEQVPWRPGRDRPNIWEQARHAGSRRMLGEQVIGMAMHDAYHAGQIALIARLAESSGSRGRR